jgi:general stress protein YciG
VTNGFAEVAKSPTFAAICSVQKAQVVAQNLIIAEEAETTSVRRPIGTEGEVITERKERRGFASMSPEKQREIASKGGRAAHQKGTAHEWTTDEARSAGRKGGQVSRGGRGRLIVPPEPAQGDQPNVVDTAKPVPGADGNL